jgi:hypothetical protein
MPEKSVKYQRQLIGVEIKLGFLYVPAPARPLLPNETKKIKVYFSGDSKPKDQSYNADYNRIFGLTSWYKKNKLEKGSTLNVEITTNLVTISVATETIIEETDETSTTTLIDISGLSSQAKGNIGEDRIKEIILLNSQGLLNVYKPVIDDRGIDLIVLKEGVFIPIYLQVKSRFNVKKNNQLILSISMNTFKTHHAYYLVGISYDPDSAEIEDQILFIPSKKLIELANVVKYKGNQFYRVNVSYTNAHLSKYKKYFMTKKEFVESLFEKFEIMGEMLK